MDWGSVIGLVALMGGVTAALGMATETYRRRLAHRERMAELAAAKPAETPAAARIEARLRVLERIATDKSGNLAASIEHLRDPSLVD